MIDSVYVRFTVSRNLNYKPNSKTKVKSSMPKYYNYLMGMKLLHTDSEKASVLNSFFGGMFTKENLINLPQMDNNSHRKSLSNIHISPELVCCKARSLSPSKSLGPDGYHPKLFKESTEQLCTTLSLLFNKSAFTEGVLPQDLESG